MTMHGTIMVFFLFTAVLTGGFGNFLIPLQIGARDMAFPFLNALSYWVFLLSCIVIFSALFVTSGAPMGGWTAYAPAQRFAGRRAWTGHGHDAMDHRDCAIQHLRSDGRSELHHHDPHDADQGPVDDAAAVDAVVAADHVDPRSVGFPGSARQLEFC